MTLVDYDPGDPAVRANPWPVFHDLQAHEPVHRSSALRAWVLTRYDHVREVLLDSRFSTERIGPFIEHLPEAAREPMQVLDRAVGEWAIFQDPPNHTRLRGLMNRAFTPNAAERMRPVAQRVVDRLLDEVSDAGQMDVIREFAFRLPILVICEMLGLPGEHFQMFKDWCDELALFVGGSRAIEDKYPRARRAAHELIDYFRRQIADRRTSPRDDLISGLVTARDEAARLSEDELVAQCILLLFAGNEATSNLIGNGTLVLLRHPAALDQLRRNPDIIQSAVEELLRFESPAQSVVRLATEDIEIDGTMIRKGDRLHLLLNAANRDPTRFPDADTLDLLRDPNPHIAFGHGIHYCIGGPLAKVEAQVAFSTMLRRFEHLTLEIDEPEWLDSMTFRGVKSLPVSFRAVLNSDSREAV